MSKVFNGIGAGTIHETFDERRARLKAQWPQEDRGKRYPHDTSDTWLRSPFYCVKCGKQDCWQHEHEGSDFYVESTVTCKSCGHEQACMPEWENWPEPKS